MARIRDGQDRVIDDPKKPGKVIVGAWLRVTDLHKVIQTTINRQAAGGILEWPSNIPSSEIWVQLIEDKGGTATKLLLKFLNVKRADSVYHTVLVGMLDRHKDCYEHLSEAFAPLYEQYSKINQCGRCVFAPWVQRLPLNFVAREGDMFPMPLTEKEHTVLRKNQSSKRRRALVLDWERPKIPTKKLKITPPLPLLLTTAAPPSACKHETQPLLPIPSESDRSQMHASGLVPDMVPLQHPSRCDSAMPSTPSTPAMPTSPTTPAAQLIVATPNTAPTTPAAQLIVATPSTALLQEHCVDPNTPPTEQRPDCFPCSRPWAQKTSGRDRFAFAGCPCAKREAGSTSNSHESSVPLALQGCTWSCSCSTCLKQGGQWAALAQQWRECPPDQRGRAVRRLRLFFGGDFMSQAAPMGHGGPTSKFFCLFCLAKLHETNVAGVCHCAQQPEGLTDPRSEAAANPPARAGSFSYDRQSGAFAKALAEHKPGLGRKPEAMDYDSCVNRPLFAFTMMEISRIPLHLFLGLGTQQIALLEMRLKALDAVWAAGRGKELANLKMEAKLREQQAMVVECRRSAEAHERRDWLQAAPYVLLMLCAVICCAGLASPSTSTCLR